MTDIVDRLREAPVWMVGEMTPGWQQHGATAYEAADNIEALRSRVAELEGALSRVVDAPMIDHWDSQNSAQNIARAALQGDKE